MLNALLTFIASPNICSYNDYINNLGRHQISTLTFNRANVIKKSKDKNQVNCARDQLKILDEEIDKLFAAEDAARYAVHFAATHNQAS